MNTNSPSNDRDVVIFNNEEFREIRNDYVFFENKEEPDPQYEKEYYIHRQIERTIDECDVVIFKTQQNENSVELERFLQDQGINYRVIRFDQVVDEFKGEQIRSEEVRTYIEMRTGHNTYPNVVIKNYNLGNYMQNLTEDRIQNFKSLLEKFPRGPNGRRMMGPGGPGPGPDVGPGGPGPMRALGPGGSSGQMSLYNRSGRFGYGPWGRGGYMNRGYYSNPYSPYNYYTNGYGGDRDGYVDSFTIENGPKAQEMLLSREVRSLNDGYEGMAPVIVQVENRSSKWITINMVDWYGSDYNYREVGFNEECTVDTFVSKPLVFQVNGIKYSYLTVNEPGDWRFVVVDGPGYSIEVHPF